MLKNRKDKKVYWHNEILFSNENEQTATACNMYDSHKKAELKKSDIF